MGEMIGSLIQGAWMSLGRLLRGRPTLVEGECVQQTLAFAVSTLPAALCMTLLNGFVFAYLVMFRFPTVESFRAVALPEMGGLYIVHLIPLSIARLAVIKGVVATTSDIASMRVSQELDSLEVIGIHPVHLVLMPRVLALAITAPSLFVLGIFSAFAGSWLACQFTFQPSLGEAWNVFLSSVTSFRALVALLRISLIAVLVAILGGYFGFRSDLTRVESVGRTTTNAVVAATLLIAAIDLTAALVIP